MLMRNCSAHSNPMISHVQRPDTAAAARSSGQVCWAATGQPVHMQQHMLGGQTSSSLFWKYDIRSKIRLVSQWRTILPNSILIWFEITQLSFSEERCPNKKKNNKMSSDRGSVADPKFVISKNVWDGIDVVNLMWKWWEGGLFLFAAILILYLTTWLDFDNSTATSIYHAFVVLCYFSPLLGAIIADGYLGKYRSVFTSCKCQS